MEFNAKDILNRLGASIQRELRKKMVQQIGVDGRRYEELKPETVLDKYKKGFNNTKFLRMIRSKDFQNNAYEYTVSGNVLTVRVSDGLHGREIKSLLQTSEAQRGKLKGAVGFVEKRKLMMRMSKRMNKTSRNLSNALSNSNSYTEIARWQNSDKSKFFPTMVEEVNALKSVQSAIPELRREVLRQAKMDMYMKIRELNARHQSKI